MMNQFKFPLLLTLAAFFSCKSTQYTPIDFPEAQLSFGTGGGYSGVVTEYILLENGQFFKKTGQTGDYEQAKKIKARLTKQLFGNYDFLNLAAMDYNHPGNLYYFITHKSEGKEHNITWGDGNTPIDNNVKTFYRNLTQLVKESSFAPPNKPVKK